MTLMSSTIVPPKNGQKITIKDGVLNIPNSPIIPFIEGDGTGPDIWRASQRVLDAAVSKAYNNTRKIHWMEVYAGEKSNEIYGKDTWLPEETLELIREHLIAIKGPMTTPTGGGIRSINVTLRQKLDLYVCLRPIRYFKGVPSPVKKPEDVSMTIFRENTEDIYVGIEFESQTEGAKAIEKALTNLDVLDKVRFPQSTSYGIKPISVEGSQRLIRSAIQYTIDNNLPSLTLVHKGNIMKFTEGTFCSVGYELAKNEFQAKEINGGPWLTFKDPKTQKDIVIKDVLADAFLQQILTRPTEYSVVATMNLNGDYISDALAAQIGGIGIAPGANINYQTGMAIFEATHGTAPKYANQDKVNPSSLILSGEMMLRYMKWTEAADLIIASIEKSIQNKTVTYDFARMMDNPQELKCSEFGDALIQNMKILA